MVVLVGCAADAVALSPRDFGSGTRAPLASPTPLPDPVAAPQVTPKPTAPPPRALTRSEAGSAYLKVATAFNKTMDRLARKYGVTSKGTAQRTLQAQASKAAGTFIIDLRTIRFPKADVADAKALMRQTVAFMNASKAAARSSDDAVLGLMLADVAKAQRAASRLAASLRRDLGLRRPPADTRGRSDRRF